MAAGASLRAPDGRRPSALGCWRDGAAASNALAAGPRARERRPRSQAAAHRARSTMVECPCRPSPTSGQLPRWMPAQLRADIRHRGRRWDQLATAEKRDAKGALRSGGTRRWSAREIDRLVDGHAVEQRRQRADRCELPMQGARRTARRARRRGRLARPGPGDPRRRGPPSADRRGRRPAARAPRPMACSGGSWPPAGHPGPRRVTAAAMPGHGSGGSTGASVPKGMSVPARSRSRERERHRSACSPGAAGRPPHR